VPWHAPTLVKKHKCPTPQINLGQKIIKSTKRVTLMDASDGLADCLIQISNESNVKIVIDEGKIPVSKDFLKACKILKKNSISLALYGGEDYELVGTASKKDIEKNKKIKSLKIIGEVLKGSGSFLKTCDKKLVKLDMKKGFKHFE
jgi:thiamine-monophosphate kinase